MATEEEKYCCVGVLTMTGQFSYFDKWTRETDDPPRSWWSRTFSKPSAKKICWEGNIKIKTTADCKDIDCEGEGPIDPCEAYVNQFNDEQGDRSNWDLAGSVDYGDGGATIYISFTVRQAVKIGCCSDPGCAIAFKVDNKKVQGCSAKDHDPIHYAIIQDLLDKYGVGSRGKPKFPKCCSVTVDVVDTFTPPPGSGSTVTNFGDN